MNAEKSYPQGEQMSLDFSGWEIPAPKNTAPADQPARTPAKAPVATKNLGKPIGGPFTGYDAVIATDGACSGNPGPGGWAWVNQLTGEYASGGSRSTTNNIMELTALLSALENTDPTSTLLIRADSQYVINIVTKWARGWKAKGWKKANGKPVANRELVERIMDLYDARKARTDFVWVRGHSGDAGNEFADTQAVLERDKF